MCLSWNFGFLTSKLHSETLYCKIQNQFVPFRLYREGCGCVCIENLRQVMPHGWRLQKEILFYVNVGVVMSCRGHKWRGGLSEFRCSAVRTHYTRAIRQITRAPLFTYIQYFLSDVTKQYADNLSSSCAQTYKIWYTHNLWYVDICCTVNTKKNIFVLLRNL